MMILIYAVAGFFVIGFWLGFLIFVGKAIHSLCPAEEN